MAGAVGAAGAIESSREAAVRRFLESVGEPVGRATALRFLRARKFDVERASALFARHSATRRREGLAELVPEREPLRSELETGKFTVLPRRDANGAAVALFTAHLHVPEASTHRTTLQGIVYQLDVALESAETQRAGLVFIYDMSDSKYSNFDLELSQKILTLLKGGYPARLKKVLVVTAPLWFKAPFKILRLFVKEKLRERVFTVSVPQLPLHVPKTSLPTGLGGELRLDHAAWLARCREHDSPSPPSPPAPPSAPRPEDVMSDEEEERRRDCDCDSPDDDDDEDSVAAGDGARSPAAFLAAVNGLGRSGLVAEYEEIRARPPDGTFTHTAKKPNLPKNRYNDVPCYDHSRVRLSVGPDDDPCSDYINANYVDGYKEKNAFISTQGPLPNTFADFWRMVWEVRSAVVVMTTRTVEQGRPKCGQYWQTEPGRQCQYGNFTILTESVEANSDYVVSELILTESQTGDSRKLSHWQFVGWPDYGVPGSAGAVLRFVGEVRARQARDAPGRCKRCRPPVVVHCSAGIGRTGTFCALDISIARLEDTGLIDVRGTVEKIRSQRAHSIQMPDQYIFCHLALVEYALARGHLRSADLTGFDDGDDSD